MKKTLITSGCSFTAPPAPNHDMTWPYWLADAANLRLINLARASQGNGIISRKILHEALSHLNNDILVGIMWSGTDRYDFYHENAHAMVSEYRKADLQWYQNPAKVVATDSTAGWVVCNVHWDDTTNRMHYQHFHSRVGSVVYTIEHILRTQWFLKQHQIDYFMTTYNDSVLPQDLIEHPEISYLYQQIDFENFLPILGMSQWCESTGRPFRKNDQHPTGDHHREFANDIVVPYLQQRGVLC